LFVALQQLAAILWGFIARLVEEAYGFG